ncbi:alternative ribosome rescue aminoacyl-tRNA hydrolase ArfB [Streptomyces polyrhachis]|uniref:Alternative ribosome rescue aminoacyl-tRNA hydrolase ArfB n=1 Tax=Streptomyces polyrhachis TaxID=1282885 RepID=A0ABW2GHT1_9ACTN
MSGPTHSAGGHASKPPQRYRIRGSVSLPEAELMWRFSRSSGPGGQHVNTSDSQVELRFDLAATRALPEVWRERALERLAGRLLDGGVVSVRASEHRSQWRNREAAAVKLTALLAEATAPPPKARRATRIPRGINERRLREKKQRAETKRGRGGGGWD